VSDTDLIRFRPGELAGELEARAQNGTSASLVAKRDLERYYRLLHDGDGTRGRLPAFALCGPERQAVVRFITESHAQPHSLLSAWTNTHTARNLAQHYGVSHSTIAAKLRYYLPPSALYALVDEAERSQP
jgi:hypothetical protein